MHHQRKKRHTSSDSEDHSDHYSKWRHSPESHSHHHSDHYSKRRHSPESHSHHHSDHYSKRRHSPESHSHHHSDHYSKRRHSPESHSHHHSRHSKHHRSRSRDRYDGDRRHYRKDYNSSAKDDNRRRHRKYIDKESGSDESSSSSFDDSGSVHRPTWREDASKRKYRSKRPQRSRFHGSRVYSDEEVNWNLKDFSHDGTVLKEVAWNQELENLLEVIPKTEKNSHFPTEASSPKRKRNDGDGPSEKQKSKYHKAREDEFEEKADYDTLLALNDVDLVSNVEKFVCPVCFFHVDVGEGVTLHECLHSFCKRCLVEAIQFSKTPEVKCPFMNDLYSCECNLQEKEIKSLVTPEVYERHLQKSIPVTESQAENFIQCKYQDCPGWCILDDLDNNTACCTVCMHTNCLTCAAVHEGKNCHEYLDDVYSSMTAYMRDSNEKARQTTEYLQYQQLRSTYATPAYGYPPTLTPIYPNHWNINKIPSGSANGHYQPHELSNYNRYKLINSQQVNYAQPPPPPSTQQTNSKYHKAQDAEFEEKADYQTLLTLNDVDLVSNVEKFVCPICFLDVDVGEGVTLHECLHNFCKKCLAGVIQFSETPEVKCPFVNDLYSCEFNLQELEIKSLVTPEEYEKHLQKSIALAESQAANSFHCKTPDCPGWCLFEDDVNTFSCSVCMHTNCLTCAAIHEGKNCRQYQDDIAFMCDSNEEAGKTTEYLQDKINNGEAMKCPKCRIVIVKKSGCDWIQCTMCHTEICWATKGPRWGPGGKGDTSGGCKCKVNGIPCHPKCGYCH